MGVKVCPDVDVESQQTMPTQEEPCCQRSYQEDTLTPFLHCSEGLQRLFNLCYSPSKHCISHLLPD